MPRHKTLRYPTEKIVYREQLLRKALRRIRRQFERTIITRDECRRLGEAAIKENYTGLIAEINTWVTGKGLGFGVTGEEPELRRGVTESVSRWRNLVDDLPAA